MMPDLNDLRKEIDRLDQLMIKTINDRFSAVDKIGQIKKLQNLLPLDQSRWNEVVESRLAWARELGVSEDFVKQLLDLIHTEALRIEHDAK